MMNKLSIAINIIFVIAIGYLYYHNFSNNENKTETLKYSKTTTANDSSLNANRIAYVELDSLNENISYFKQRRKELEQTQKEIEAKISNDYKILENKQNNFQLKHATATPDEVQNFRAQMAHGQEEIEIEKQKQTQILNQKSFELVENIQKNLKEFLAEYNKQKQYQYILTCGSGMDIIIYKDSTLNITNDVIKGMNEKMKLKPN